MSVPTEITQKLLKILRQSLPKKYRDAEFGLDQQLNELGLDSLGFMELLLSLEEEFNVNLSENISILENIFTPNDLINLIDSQSNYECRV